MKYIFKHEKMVLLKKKRFISRKNAFLDPYEGQTALDLGKTHKKSDF